MPAPAHSPLPWVCDYSHVFRKSGGLIASVQTPRDAAHIVLCVNSHDALVAALRNVADVASKLVDQSGSSQAAFIRDEARAALATLNA